MSLTMKSALANTLLIALWIFITSNNVAAAPVPVDTSSLDQTVTDQTQYGLGGTVSVAQRPFIGVDNQTTTLPYIRYRYQDFYIEGINFGYTLYKKTQDQKKKASIDLLATPRFYEVKASFADGGELNGIEKTEPTYLAGFSAQYLAGPATLTLQLLADIGESDGYELILNASKTYKPHADLTIAPTIGITYQDEELVDHFYGVQAQEVAINRPQYSARASLNPHLTVTAIWQATKQIQLLGQMKYEKLGGGTTDSPIVDEDNIVTTVIGAVYLF